jgi:hypothetical protein
MTMRELSGSRQTLRASRSRLRPWRSRHRIPRRSAAGVAPTSTSNGRFRTSPGGTAAAQAAATCGTKTTTFCGLRIPCDRTRIPVAHAPETHHQLQGSPATDSAGRTRSVEAVSVQETPRSGRGQPGGRPRRASGGASAPRRHETDPQARRAAPSDISSFTALTTDAGDPVEASPVYSLNSQGRVNAMSDLTVLDLPWGVRIYFIRCRSASAAMKPKAFH